MNLREICLTLCREIHQLVPYDHASINLPHGENSFIVYAEESRLQAPVIPAGVSEAEGTATGWVMRHDQPVICRDVPTDDRFPLSHTRYGCVGIRSYVILPLRVEQELLGALDLGSLSPNRFSDQELAILTPIADILALAIQSSRLYEKSREREDMQKLLKELNQDIAVLNVDTLLQKLTFKIREVLKVDVSDVRLMTDGEWRSIGVSGTEAGSMQPGGTGAGRGLSRSVIETGQPLIVSDMIATATSQGRSVTSRHGFRGYVGVPLFSRNGEVIGVLRVLSYPVRNFSADEVDLLQQLAAGAAIALENSRLFEELKKKSAELEDAYRLKTDFLNTMAHELRTPLNVIIGTQQLLAEGSYGKLDALQLKPLERVGQYSRDLLDLINEILDLMRLDAKKVPLHPEDLFVRDITDDLELSFEPLAREKKLKLDFHIAENLPPFRTDGGRLKEVLQNLLGNALKYTDRGTVDVRVSAQASEQDPRIVWSVSDTGIGISGSDLPHIFEPFYMAEEVDRRKYPGSGLGLSIVQRIVDLLGGDIQVRSEHGKGSTFTVSLPVHPKKSEYV
jgi:signal transduction histidine kinase